MNPCDFYLLLTSIKIVLNYNQDVSVSFVVSTNSCFVQDVLKCGEEHDVWEHETIVQLTGIVNMF